MVIFTIPELFALRLDKLQLLCSYYRIDWKGKKKEELVNLLAPHLSMPDPVPVPDNPVSDEGVPMSVRVKRIYDSSRGVQ